MAGSNGVHQAAAAGGGRGGAAAALYAAGRSQPPGAALSPLSETLWRAKSGTMTSSVAGAAGDQQKLQPHRDFSARLTWVDLWVTVTGRGPKHAILQGLTGIFTMFSALPLSLSLCSLLCSALRVSSVSLRAALDASSRVSCLSSCLLCFAFFFFFFSWFGALLLLPHPVVCIYAHFCN